MTIYAEIHGELNQRLFGRGFPLSDFPVTPFAFKLSQTHVLGMRIIDMVWHMVNSVPGDGGLILNEPVKFLLLLAFGEPLLVTFRADFDIGQSREFIFPDILMTVHTFQALLFVFHMIEGDRLPHPFGLKPAGGG